MIMTLEVVQYKYTLYEHRGQFLVDLLEIRAYPAASKRPDSHSNYSNSHLESLLNGKEIDNAITQTLNLFCCRLPAFTTCISLVVYSIGNVAMLAVSKLAERRSVFLEWVGDLSGSKNKILAPPDADSISFSSQHNNNNACV